MRIRPTLAMLPFLLGFIAAICAGISMYGCATKSLMVQSIDESGKPFTVSGRVVYFCTDTNTKGFTAEFGDRIKIGLASQDNKAKTEMMLEFMKMVSSMP